VASRQDVGNTRQEHHNVVMYWMSKDFKEIIDSWYKQDSLKKSWTISLSIFRLVLNGTTSD